MSAQNPQSTDKAPTGEVLAPETAKDLEPGETAAIVGGATAITIKATGEKQGWTKG